MDIGYKNNLIAFLKSFLKGDTFSILPSCATGEILINLAEELQMKLPQDKYDALRSLGSLHQPS